MHQASLGVARASQGSPSRPSVPRTLKMTTQGPTRRQVLIPLTSAAAETVVANAASAVESCNKGLVSARSKLRVESVRKAWDGVSFFFFFFLNYQFVTWCPIAVCGRLSTTSSLQFWPQETKTPLIGIEMQLESIELKEKSK